ncbi:sodium channel protein type 4 subunit alpha-like isoform X2 [Xiphophorus maculatus]|uniref:sodium channel protein type 4 subunit alpha-like isoform X2 n=1 Tax=Xiphophorus maculatus TaxID=8083 RepID=UPI0006D904F8|nr:sodium channel protein type 4 subunit alpha-like isoform X2 [Xiphophorus maculatus]
MSWFEFWSSRLQRAEHLMKTQQLTPSQRNQLHGNHEVRMELQNQRMTSLLPPVGVEVFRRFTPASLEEIQQEAEKNKKKPEKDQSKPASHLQAGKPLPFIYRAPSPELLSTPLEDLDPFYQSQKTFIVICKKKLIHRFDADPACYLLSPFNCLRSSAIRILLHPIFSVLFILTILTNCILMTMPHMLWTRDVEYVFMIIYIGEVILKLLSRGVCFGRFTFLRDPWNWLDVLNIISSVIAMSVGLREFAALKTISRVLKLFSYMPGPKKTAERLVQSLKWLAIAMVLMVFVLSILALIGTQFFMGVLKHKCVISSPSGRMDTPTTEQPEYFVTHNETIHFYDNFVFEDYINKVENLYFMPGQSDPMLCGNSSDSRRCPRGFTCMKTGRNPEYGFTSFDTFSWSLLAVVRIAMQDLSDVLLQLTLQAAGKAYMSVFVLVFFPGCFLVVSLFVAVVAIALVKQEKAEAAEAKKTEEEFSWIVKVLKKREDSEVTGETELLEEHDSAQKKKPAARTLHQENVTVEDTKDEVQPSCCSCTDRILQGECCICSQWLKLKLRPFVLSQFFDLGIIICIIINTIFMAMDHHEMRPKFGKKLANSNVVFTAIFTAELLLKVLALGIKGYFKVSWHIFDFIVIILSLLDLCLANVKGLSLLRSVRLLRPLRLGRWWSDLGILMKMTWFSVGNLSVVLVFVVFMFAVVGTQLFQQNYQDHEENVCMFSSRCKLPRWHMMDFSHSFLLVFRVLSGEWIECMWDCMKISNKGLCVIYYMAVVLIGNILVLNLFLHLFLSPFCTNKPGSAAGQGPNKRHAGSWILESFRALTGKRTHANTDQKVESKNKDRQDYLALTPVSSGQPSLRHHSNDSVKDSSVVELSRSPGNIFKIQADTNNEEKKQNHGDVQELQDNKSQTENSPGDCCCAICYNCCPIQDIDTSKGAGRGWYKFRKACLLIVQHRLFEIFIIFIVLLSSAALALEDTMLFHRPVLQMVLDKADQVFTFLFLMEMLLKWTAFGFKKYFSSFWCWLDFLILDVSLFSSVCVMLGHSAAYLRTLRALRTLRVPSRFKGTRAVLRVMAATAPSMCNSLLVVLFVWLIFSILGVNLFAGRFAYCSNHTDGIIFEVNNKMQCYELVGSSPTEVYWKYTEFNFDHVGMGLLSLLIMATSADWKEIIYSAVDSTEVDIQPVHESRPVMYLYFVLFIIFGCFFSANLFIRFFVDALHQLSNKAGGKHVFMTEEQLKFHGTVRKMFSKSPEKSAPRPTNRFQARLFDLVTAPLFEILVVVLICVNVVVMMMESDDLSEQGQEVLMWFLYIFLILYCIEFFLKITALRRHYFSFGLNILDFVVLIFMILGLFISDLLAHYFVSPAALFLLRLARISRVLPFFRLGRRIQMLLTGFMMSLPALMNIGLLFLLVVYTYSFVGTRIFYMINFGTIGDSMISMILFSLSPTWSLLVRNSTKYSPPTVIPLGYWANLSAGVVFFCSYVLLHLLLVVHLFIAVILESFNSREAEDAVLLQMFYNTWRKFDPEASQVIQYSELSDFCDALQDPLRIPKPNNIRLINMDLPLLPGDQICCLDVLKALMTQTFGEEREMESLKDQLEKKFTGNNRTQVSHEPISSTLKRKQEEVAAAVIQRAFRKHQAQNGAPDQPEDKTTGVSASSQ